MPATTHSFGALLRRYRALAGLTQESLAERAGISTRAVSDLERGINRAPRAETLELLAAGLGLSPQERATLIATAHPDLDASPGMPSAPPHPVDMPGSGSRRLPLSPTPLIGREAELLRGLPLLQSEETRLVTVTGPGGVGKTHLALELARQSAARFAAGVCFVDLAPIHDATLVPAALAQALGLREPPTGTLLDTLKETLRDRAILLLLDNAEQVVACAPVLADLLAACLRLSLLVTSRTPLRLRAERVLTIAPLALPDATALFYARAEAIRDELTLAPAEVAALCEQVDCLPLAIELCAAQLGALSLGDLRQRLDAGMELPRAGARDLPPRHQTLRQTIGWSYDLLPPTAQALFRRLAVFAGGCALPAVQAVCLPADDVAHDVLADIMALVDASLLRARTVADDEQPSETPSEMRYETRYETRYEMRYETLATIQEDARDRLRHAGEYERYARRHADYFASLVGDEATLAREMPNARAALTWARETGNASVGLALLARFGRSWYISGLLSELRGWLDAFLALDAASETPAPQALRAHALYATARLAYDRGEAAAAATLARASLEAARPAGDFLCMSDALAMLGQIAQSLGEIERARTLFDESLTAARASNVPRALSAALGNTAQIAQAQGNMPRAVALLEEALAVAHASRSLWGEAVTYTHLGLLMFAQQRYAQARRHYASALGLYHTFGSDVYLAWCLEAVAALNGAEGQWTRAVAVSAGAETLRAQGHAPRPVGEQEAFERVLAAGRVALGEDAYQRAWDAGSADAATRDALIRLALGVEDARSR